jgi:hypothetical protein
MHYIFLDIAVHNNVPYDITLLTERETMAEPVENENDGNYIYIGYCCQHSSLFRN